MNNIDTRKRVVKSLFWVYCETISAQLMSFVVTIILARLLSPSDYGVIALVAGFINISSVFVTSGMGTSLVQKKDADMLDYNTMFWANLVIALVLYLGLFVGAPWIAGFYDNSTLTLVIRVLALRVPISAYNTIQTAYVTNRMIFKKSFISTSLGAILSGVVGIVMAYMGGGIWALVSQSIFSVIFNTIFLMFIVEWKPRIEFSLERFKVLYRFGWKILVTSLMFTGYSELRTLVIGKKYTTDDLGYYNKGHQFPQIVASNIDTTINRVMFPALSKCQDNPAELVNMTRRSAKTSAYIMTPILFGLAVVANNVVGLLLTDKWLPCVPYMQIMCIMWWMQPTQSCSIQAIKAIGRSDLYLRIEVINKVIGIGLLVVSILMFNTPLAIAASMLVGQLVAVFIYGLFVDKYIGYRLYHQLHDLFLPAILGFAMCLVVYFVGTVIDNRLLALVIQVMVGAIIYILLSIVFKVEEFTYLKRIIFRKGVDNDTIS